METKIMAAVLNDNVIDKVVGRKKKEKVKPREFGADDFYSIAPDQMKQMLKRLSKLHEIAKALDVESAIAVRAQIEAMEEILCQKLTQIEAPDSPDTATKIQRWLEQQRPQDPMSNGNGQIWINTTPDTVTAPYIQPYGTGGGSGGSGDIIWRTMDTTTTIPSFTSGDEEIPDLGGLLPTSSDDY